MFFPAATGQVGGRGMLGRTGNFISQGRGDLSYHYCAITHRERPNHALVTLVHGSEGAVERDGGDGMFHGNASTVQHDGGSTSSIIVRFSGLDKSSLLVPTLLPMLTSRRSLRIGHKGNNEDEQDRICDS